LLTSATGPSGANGASGVKGLFSVLIPPEEKVDEIGIGA